LTNIGASNGLLRQYFPKGTDLSRWSRDEIEAVAAALNARPRKTLAWKTPARPSTSTYARCNKPVLRQPVESGNHTSYEYATIIAELGMRQSVGRTGIFYITR